MRLLPFTRITRTLENINNNTYTIMNVTIGKEAVLDSFSYNLLKYILNDKFNFKWWYLLFPKQENLLKCCIT